MVARKLDKKVGLSSMIKLYSQLNKCHFLYLITLYLLFVGYHYQGLTLRNKGLMINQFMPKFMILNVNNYI